jgi:type IV pilus assembly protein PilO
LPWYAQIGAFVLLAGSGVGAFFYYYEAPMRTDMATRRAQLATLRADVTKGYATAKRLPEFRAQVTELEARLANLKSVLPEEKDAADLLRRLQTVATQSNLTIKGFKPSPVVTKQLHAEWPIALQLDGTYHNLATFFDRVGRFTRIINIRGVDVKGKDKPDPNSTITATCVATTFVLLDKEALAKTATKSTGTKPAAAKPAVPAKKAA